MTRQIAVRLPDDLVDFMDRLVREGRESSRASVVSKAVERERRREQAPQDARILAAAAASGDDLDTLAGYAASLPLDIE